MGAMDRQLILLLLFVSPLFGQYTDFGNARIYNSGKGRFDSLIVSGTTTGGLLTSHPFRGALGSSIGLGLSGTGGGFEYGAFNISDSISTKGWYLSYRDGKTTSSERRKLHLDFYDGSVFTTYSSWDSIGNFTNAKNITATAGYVDSDSTLDDGTTWRTSVAYHSGLGASSMGNISTGTINSNGNSITGGAGSFTTGTFSGTITQNGNATGNLVINNSTGTPISVNVYSNSATTGAVYQSNRARGTSNSSYSAIQSADVIGGMLGSGAYSASAFSGNTVAIRMLAAENYSATNQATYIDMATTAIGATSRTVDFLLRKVNALPELTIGDAFGTGKGNFYIDSLYFGTTLAIDANRKHTNVGGIATTGAHGVAPIVDTVTYTSMSSGMSKNLTSTAGMYRLLYTIFCTTADAAAGSVQLTLSFNNGAAQTMTSAAVNLTSTANKDDDAFIFYVASGTPSISTAITGSAGTSKYSVHAVVERLK